jgi:hypothetical protein
LFQIGLTAEVSEVAEKRGLTAKYAKGAKANPGFFPCLRGSGSYGFPVLDRKRRKENHGDTEEERRRERFFVHEIRVKRESKSVIFSVPPWFKLLWLLLRVLCDLCGRFFWCFS